MKIKKILIVLIPLLVILIALIAIINSGDTEEPEQTTQGIETTVPAKTTQPEEASLLHGELLSVTENGDIAVVKAKITSSYNNEATVTQNYFNVVDLINKQGFDKYSEIQYWAVADMNNGEEEKVISFTVPADLIEKIKNKKVIDNQLGSYVQELWVHQSLR